MSTSVKEKKPFLPQRKVPAPPSGSTVAVRTGSTSRAGSAVAPLSIGGEPRVHLLPVEVAERKKAKELKRRLLFAGGVVVVLVALGYVLATFSLTSVQSQLAGAQAKTASLIAQQSKYSAVTTVDSDIAAIQQAQVTTTTQEILWAPYLATLENSLPAGASISSFNAVMDSPLGTPPATVTTGPLQGPRIATVQLSVLIQQGNIPGWLNTLPSLKGFVDATPNSVAADGGTGLYTLAVTIHVNNDAVSDRFAKAGSDNK